MVKLISRTDVFEKYPHIGRLVSEFQKALDDGADPEYCAIDSEEDQSLKDAIIFNLEPVKTFNEVIGIDENNIDIFPSLLANELAALFNILGIEELIVISHYRMNFFGNLKNKFAPLKKAYRQLHNITENYDYRGTFDFTLSDLPVMINIAFWLERCDPSVPEYIFFTDKYDRITFYLCKHGKVHFMTTSNIINDKLLANSNLKTFDDCWDDFSTSGKIKGRRLSF